MGCYLNVNCKKKNGDFCTDTRVPAVWFGLGPRLCTVSFDSKCPYQEPHQKPKCDPPGQTPQKKN